MAEQPTPPRVSARPIAAEVDGTRLELLETGAQRLDAVLELIRTARTSLRMLFYMYYGDAAGAAVRDALVEAARRGVKVKLLLDGYGCSDVKADFFKPVDEAGGQFCLFHPRYGRRYLIRNHQKLVIADDSRALIGGSNIAETYLRDDHPKRWRDLWLALDGPAVHAAGAYFDSLYHWTTTKGAKLRHLRRLIVRHSQSHGPLQWQFSGPLSLRNPWPTGIAAEIASGRHLDLIAAYFSPPRALLRRIGRIGRRGRARIITAARSDNNATIAAARHTYARLLRRRVHMYEYQPSRLHTKLVIIDDVVHIGSANFDFRSMYMNLEIMLRIADRGFAEAMRSYFEREMKDSVRITPALHRRRATLWRRLKWTLSHFLVTTMDYTVTRRLNFGDEA